MPGRLAAKRETTRHLSDERTVFFWGGTGGRWRRVTRGWGQGGGAAAAAGGLLNLSPPFSLSLSHTQDSTQWETR